MTDPKHTEPVVVVTPNDSMCGGLYPVHGSVTHGRTVECCDFCGLPADYEPARTAAEAASRQEVERLREALGNLIAACDAGRTVPKGGACGMTIEAQIRASVINGVPAWPVEEARAALTGSR